MQSKARESLPIFCHLCSLLIPCEPMQSSFAPQPIKSPPCHTTLCSLHSYKIPLQSPYISPISKVPPHHARLSVSICSVYLCGLGVTFAPLRLALTIGERAVICSIQKKYYFRENYCICVFFLLPLQKFLINHYGNNRKIHYS